MTAFLKRAKRHKITQDAEHLLSVIADGAAFGAFVARVLEYAQQRGKTLLYLPESFEWLVLKSGVVTDKEIEEKKESSKFFRKN